jgi:hypothetical protein
LAGGFVPAVSDTITLMTFDSRAGTFATETLPDPGPGKAFAINYSDTDVILEVIPE